MRLLIVSLSTYTSPYFRGLLDSLAPSFEAVEVVAADIPTLWGPSAAPASSTNYTLHVLQPRLDRTFATIVLPGLGRIAARFRPTSMLIGCEPWQFLCLQSLAIAARQRIPAGIHFAENGPRLEGAGGLVRRPLARLALSRCVYAIQWSEMGADLSRKLAPHVPVGIIPNGVSQEFFSPWPEPQPEARRRWFGADAAEHPTAAYVGRLAAEKGIDDLLEAFDLLHARLDVRVAIAGAGPLKPTVDAWVARRPWAVFHGLLERTAVPGLFAAADAAVLPSRRTRTASEQFGMAALEALAAGTPVAAFDTGALREAVGDGGTIVPEGDVQALTEALATLLTAPVDDRRQARERARRRAAEFTYARLAQRHVEFWAGLPSETARAILGPRLGT
jgi:glycosyltransferase involved in cell wall biosynthesis